MAIPITILTGFLGAGKTTILNQIISENKNKKFGLVINEFGQVNIDSEILSQEVSKDEIFQISKGCICCIVREDLINAVRNLLLKHNDLEYIFIETSGLADPIPVAQTFEIDDLDGRVYLDSIITIVDGLNHFENIKNYRIANSQLIAADIIILNKTKEIDQNTQELIIQDIKQRNPEAYIILDQNLNVKHLIESQKWSFEKILNYQKTQNITEEQHHNHENHDECLGDCGHCHEEEHKHSHSHQHIHDEVEEFLFTTDKFFDPDKFNDWIINQIPHEIIRAKGFIKFKNLIHDTFLFQMVGSRKLLVPFIAKDKNFDTQTTRIVFIGTKINKSELEKGLQNILNL